MRFVAMAVGPMLALTSAAGPAGAAPTRVAADASASPVVKATLDASTKRRVVDAAVAQMRDHYVFAAKVPVIARALRQALATPAVAEARDGDAFAAALNRTLSQVSNDRHLRLVYSAQPLPPPPSAGSPPPGLSRMQAAMARKNFAMPKAELLPGNIGYLKIDLFARPERAGPTFAAAMAFLQHSDAMIVDLRDNRGGDPGMVALAASYFVPGETLLNTFRRRGQADEQSWSLPVVPGGRWSSDKPLFILIGHETASGAEEFAYDLQMVKRATVVGQPSWGGANPGGVFPLDPHFAIFVPVGAAVNPVSGTNWEGVGVKPDVITAPAAALDTARALAIAKLLRTANGDAADELRAAQVGAGK